MSAQRNGDNSMDVDYNLGTSWAVPGYPESGAPLFSPRLDDSSVVRIF
jgi:hypothetical protein